MIRGNQEWVFGAHITLQEIQIQWFTLSNNVPHIPQNQIRKNFFIQSKKIVAKNNLIINIKFKINYDYFTIIYLAKEKI